MPMSKEAEISYGRDPFLVPSHDQEGKENQFFNLNLPPDYLELSEKGQRLARINGIRLHSTPDHFVRAWVLMRTYYLNQLPDGVFYKRRVKSSELHYHWMRDIASYQLNAWAAPRGSAKSTVLGKELPLLMAMARRHFDTLMVLAKDDFVRERFAAFMLFFEENQFLIDDFGTLKPPRGSKVWNHHILHLENGGTMTGISVEGKMLGKRPDLILPDDPEHDKTMVANPNPSSILDSYERLLFGVLIPMLREGSCLGWIGTLLSMRSFLTRVVLSNDPRFKHWNRRVDIGLQNDGSSVWKERWSVEELERLRSVLGEAEFQNQMQNNPGAASSTVFRIHPDYCTYKIEKEDDNFGINPCESRARIITQRPVQTGNDIDVIPEHSDRDLGEVASGMYRIMTVDFAFTVNKRSDFSCCQVLGFENSKDFKDTLWSLDLWLGKKRSADVVQIVLGMAYKWRVHLIAVEAVTIQQQLFDQIASGVEILGQRTGWTPKPIPIRYPTNFSKAQRIAGLEWRFNKYRIKLPRHLRDKQPYRELFRQVEGFTMELDKLPHDDAIDTLAMHQFVGRPRSRGEFAPAGEINRFDPAAQIAGGELISPQGIPYITSLNSGEIPIDALKAMNMDDDGEDNVIWQTGGMS